jgi:molecular chaperone HtpG
MAEEQKNLETFEYQAEMKQLLHLIIHSLYTHPEVFLRELISNASDALNKVRFEELSRRENILQPDAELNIDITVNSDEQTFCIEDNGIGMRKDELITEIGTVAHSGTLAFMEKLKTENKAIDAQKIIGQFGVGFYSVFMVADEVTVETRYAEKGSKGYRWKSDGKGTFTIEEIDREERGTKIYFTLKDEYKEFSEKQRVESVVKRYSNFVDFPITVNEDKVNVVEALWHKNKSELEEEELNEFYKFISNDFRPPLGHLHLRIEGVVNFKALIFIPEHAPPLFFTENYDKSLHLYSRKVMIQENCPDLLPEYLRFARGVVDTEDLPLNVSREVAQSSPVMAKIRKIITGKLLSFLQDWADNDKDKYKQFYNTFSQMLKHGINSDWEHRDKLLELLRFESSLLDEGELTSFKDYVSRMREDQKEIYYLAGDSRDVVERNPNLEYFKKNGIEVLLLLDPIDVFAVPSINEYDGKPLKSIEKADIDLSEESVEEEEKLTENLSKSLIDVFKEVLGDKVEDVRESKRLVDSPATLVIGKEGMDVQTERMMKMMNKEFTGSKRVMEINTAHPLIKNLATLTMGDSHDPLLRKVILQLYEGALLIEDNLTSPTEFMSRMTDIMTKATKVGK